MFLERYILYHYIGSMSEKMVDKTIFGREIGRYVTKQAAHPIGCVAWYLSVMPSPFLLGE